MATRLPSNLIQFQRCLTNQMKMVKKLAPIASKVAEQQCLHHHIIRRFKSKNSKDSLSSIIQPLPVTPVPKSADDINMGEEMSGVLKKDDLLKLLMKFYNKEEIRKVALENGLDRQLFHKAYISFRKFCVSSQHLPVDLHIVFSDILQGSGHVDDIFPYFLLHCHDIYPHLECMEDLKQISDLRNPTNWYAEARSIERKFIFHAGPTNSGKTHHALERFTQAKSGIYCGPLKLLASEVFQKSNDKGTRCDLITGEERRLVSEDGSYSNHIACTVEMASLNIPYDVAVIDEIQMIKDSQRGWAWTRAVLGLYAREIHLCGEASCIDLIQELALSTGDEVEIRRYKRLTDLTYLDYAVEKFENVRPGDCIVCFSKNDIYYVTRQLEMLNKECAVIYGSLPPSTKLAQSAKFNDVNSSCKVMVATDAIGMGLNLSIKRVIFYSLVKPMINENGEKELDLISTSQALQIGGRAGRFNTIYAQGEVTTFNSKDLPTLKEILNQPVEPVMQAGLQPTMDQIELFAFHLPKSSMSNLIDIFELICELDGDTFFMCSTELFKFLADIIEHVPLHLRVRYTFCCAPIPVKQPFACTMFLKFARRFSRNLPLTVTWLCRNIGWPLKPPGNLVDLVHLECVFDVMDLYLWLSYRFQDMFPDAHHVRELQKELDYIIQTGVHNIVQLVKNQELTNAGELDSEDDFVIKTRQQQEKRYRHSFDEAIQSEEKKAKEENIRKKVSRSELAQRLVKKGVINKEVLDKLKEEWLDQLNKKSAEDLSQKSEDSDNDIDRELNEHFSHEGSKRK